MADKFIQVEVIEIIAKRRPFEQRCPTCKRTLRTGSRIAILRYPDDDLRMFGTEDSAKCCEQDHVLMAVFASNHAFLAAHNKFQEDGPRPPVLDLPADFEEMVRSVLTPTTLTRKIVH